MIISKYGKSYDTADGSEQHCEDPQQPSGGGDIQPVDTERTDIAALGDGQSVGPAGAGAASEQWEDDGGRQLREPPPSAEAPPSPLEFSAKPTWSVQSLRDLNEAVRLGDWPDNPAHLRRRALEAERARVASTEIEAQRAASRADAERHRDRNPWEHT